MASIQPSSDPAATALAIAYEIVTNVNDNYKTSETAEELEVKRAEKIAKVAKILFAAVQPASK
jgi:hypothetical protein